MSWVKVAIIDQDLVFLRALAQALNPLIEFLVFQPLTHFSGIQL